MGFLADIEFLLVYQ